MLQTPDPILPACPCRSVTALLEGRRKQQARFDAGEAPHFLEETAVVREGDWRVAPLPADFQDRRVEITGPTDRKMVINALNRWVPAAAVRRGTTEVPGATLYVGGRRLRLGAGGQGCGVGRCQEL